MRYRLICTLFTITVFFGILSCNDMSAKEVSFYHQLDTALVRSNLALQRSSGAAIRSLDAKMMEPNIAIAEKAKKWYGIAETIGKSINETYAYIEKLKQELRSEGSVAKIFTDQKNSELKQRIIQCWNTVLNIDPDITASLGSEIPLNDTIDTRIENIPVIAAITKLSKLQSDLRLTANMMIVYCDRKVPSDDCGWEVLRVIAYGNSSRYYAGETAEVFAGIGSFVGNVVPKVIISGEEAGRTPNGDYQYSFNVGNKPGNYNIPVRISYIDPNTGLPQTVTKIIRYSVEKKCPDQ